MSGFLSPYRGERYHLRDFRGRGRQPHGPEELFNYRHSSLRNCIERCFGVLKARFPILKQMPPYSLHHQRYIVIACCAIHNYIRMHANSDNIFEEYGREDFEVARNEMDIGASTSNAENQAEININSAQLRQMAVVRDGIAQALWESQT